MSKTDEIDPDNLRVTFGNELSKWPLLKVGRATELVLQLEGRLAAWNAAMHLETVMVPEPGGRVVNAVLEVHEMPPVDEWSLIVGDVLHAYRSALDAFAWDLAHLDGMEPPNATQVYFPVSSTESGFNKKVAALGNIPPIFGQRMRKFQSFAVTSGIPTLATLHTLNIDDKHRGTLRAGAKLGKIASSMLIKTTEPNTTADWQIAQPTQGLRTGETLARFVFSHPVEVIGDGRAPAEVVLIMPIAGEDGQVEEEWITVVSAIDKNVKTIFEDVSGASAGERVADVQFEVPVSGGGTVASETHPSSPESTDPDPERRA
jgi:hypothetical protein